MSDLFIVKPAGESPHDLLCAPWRDGLGGSYLPLPQVAQQLGHAADEVLCEDALAPEHHYLCAIEFDGGVCLVSLTATLNPIEVKPNRVAVEPVDPHAGHTLDAGAGDMVPLPGAFAALDAPTRKSWLQSLETQGRHRSKWLAGGESDGVRYTGWFVDGGAEAWVADRRARAHRHEMDIEKQAAWIVHDAGDSFINPYTFVPLPQGVRRARPRGHATMGADGLSGWFDWTLDFLTPLALPPDLRHTDGTALRYPGSSLRGALRSMHEALAHGCLREIDLDYTPVHREPMNVYRPAEFRLGVVTKLDNAGNVLEIELTEQPIWVLASVVHSAIPPRQLRSGSRVTVDPTGKQPRQGRFELTVPGSVTNGTDWVVHVTDAKPRSKHPDYYLAVGKLTGQRHRVEPEQWKAFQEEARGSQDLIGDESTPAKTHALSPGQPGWPGVWVQHEWSTTPQGPRTRDDIGYRRKVDSWLGLGDTVWLTKNDPSGRLKMAVIWRYHGKHPVSERLPDPARGTSSHAPCTDPANLCPTCAIFGAIDTERGQDRQAGYATHIRVGPGRSDAAVALDPVQVPPLRSPKPSSGGFYLSHPTRNAAQFAPSTNDGHVVRAHWGSALDPQSAPRTIRGRKFYWHGMTPDGQPGRHQVRAHSPQQVGTKTIVRPPLRLTARVYFDNLDAVQLAGLLAAADPSHILGQDSITLATHVGGGKPLGFGTAKPGVSGLNVQSAAGRYAGKPEQTPDLGEAARKFTVECTDTPDRSAVWDALRVALRVDAVPADRIWYPTTGNFGVLASAYPFASPGARRTAKDFDESFNWFRLNSGGRSGALRLLPDPREPNQYLPAKPEADRT